ncbi:MAG: HDOD domain-containing protein [Sphingomonadales bacterium]
MKKRIIFVDDEPNVLRGLRRNLRKMRDSWDLSFANSGQEALQLLDQSDFDAVVTDMQMPEMDGAELLREVEKRAPRTIRIVLSGQTDRSSMFSLIGPSHQFISKPCDTDILVGVLQRAFGLQAVVSDKNLQTLVSGLRNIPTLPQIYSGLIKLADSPMASLQDIAEIVSQDVGLTANILKLANSGYFGIGREVNTTVQAVSLLGTEIICSLVLTKGIMARIDGSATEKKYLQQLWEHSLCCAGYARTIAKNEQMDQKTVDKTFTAGLLHDIGRFVLHASLGKRYEKTMADTQCDHQSIIEIEKKELGSTHADVGAYLLALWGLPNEIIEAAAYHHRIQDSGFKVVDISTIVHVANGLAHSFNCQCPELNLKKMINFSYLNSIGAADRLMTWAETCARLKERISENENTTG